MSLKQIMKSAILPVLIMALASSAAATIDDDLSGAWEGTLNLSGPKIRLVFNIERAETGEYTATMDSPDQGARGIPTGEVTFRADSLFIEVPAAAGIYTGAYDRERDLFDGVWRQSGFIIPLKLTRNGEEADNSRPQDPDGPFPYREEEVEIENRASGVTLAGTLIIPDGDGPHPGVILVSGSGPQNRDEEVLGHRPFLVLADHLARAGIAVLRYDDRGVGQSTGDHAAATSVDFAGDAKAVLAFLRDRPEVDRSRAGVIGHSEGAMIATMMASRPDSPSFIVLLGGPGLDGDEILLMQTELIYLVSGIGRETTEKLVEQKKLEHDILRAEPDPARAREQLLEKSGAFFSRYTEEEKKIIGYDKDLLRQRTDLYLTPWFRFFMSYDPAPAIRLIACPVLALWGGKDLQVPPEENLAAMRAALEEGGNDDFTLEILPGMNHLFQTCETGSPDEYGMIEETFAPSALEMISDWVRRKAGI